jgi:hypothetical protein
MIAPTSPASTLNGHCVTVPPAVPRSHDEPALARRIGRALLVAVVATAVVGALGVSRITVTAVQLAATYALRGTGFNAIGGGLLAETDAQTIGLAQRYVSATYGPAPAPIIAITYPASALPPDTTYNASRAQGLAALESLIAADHDSAPVIFGFSQGANIGTQYKRQFNQQYQDSAPGSAVPQPTFVFIGNVNRPNGGLFDRFPGFTLPIADATFDGATPTHTAGAAPGQITTYDISGQYDFFSDFPTYPLNLLADVNAFIGLFAVHTNYGDIGVLDALGRLANGGYLDMSQAVLQDHYGDTAYYLIPARRLPLLAPLQLLGVPDPILAVLDAPLRVLVEAGYDRTISPGVPLTAQWVPSLDPAQVLTNFLTAIPTGIDDGLQEIGLGRPLHTTTAGPYGVGGPPVTLPSTDADASDATAATGSDVSSVARASADTAPHDTSVQADPDTRPSFERAATQVSSTASPTAAVDQPARTVASTSPTKSRTDASTTTGRRISTPAGDPSGSTSQPHPAAQTSEVGNTSQTSAGSPPGAPAASSAHTGSDGAHDRNLDAESNATANRPAA